MPITPTPTTLYFDGNAAPGYFVPIDLSILQIGAVSDYSFGATVNLRKKNTSVQNDDHCLMAFDFSYGANKGGAFYVHANDGSMNVFFGSTNYSSSTELVAYNTDQQITVTLSGTTLKAYVQGSLVWTQTIARVATTGGTNSFFCMEGFQFRGLYGTIRNIFVVKSLLTLSDVTNIVAGVYPATLGIYLKCDEAIGWSLRDSSGNSNFGLLTPDTNNSPFPDWRGSGRRRLQ